MDEASAIALLRDAGDADAAAFARPTDSAVAEQYNVAARVGSRYTTGVDGQRAARPVRDCARANINTGDGCWGGHLIERCDVFDTVLETHAHGSFNSWGRDRYWSSDRAASQAAVDAAPNLPFLDAVKATVIRDSR